MIKTSAPKNQALAGLNYERPVRVAQRDGYHAQTKVGVVRGPDAGRQVDVIKW